MKLGKANWGNRYGERTRISILDQGLLTQVGKCAAAIIVVLCSLAVPVLAQSNTWSVLSPAASSRWLPSSFTDCSPRATTANPIGRSFSGSVYGDGQIFFWGGGHAAYPANDVDVYDIATNRWTADTEAPQCIAPCCFATPTVGPGTPTPTPETGASRCDNFPPYCVPSASGQYDPNCLVGSCVITGGVGASKPAFRCSGGTRNGLLCSQHSDCTGGGTCSVGIPTPGVPCTNCRPYTEHTYQRQAFNPVRGKLLIYSASGTWEWDPTTRSWTWLGAPPRTGSGIQSRLMMWDPPRSRMLFFQFGNVNQGVQTFDYTTRVWSYIDTYMLSNQTGNSYGTWDARAARFVVVTRFGTTDKIYQYNPAITGAGAWVDVTAAAPVDMLTRCVSGLPCFGGGITFDETNQRTVAFTHDHGNLAALWAYDASANVWSKITTAGGGTIGVNSGQHNTLHYDPQTRALFLVDEQSQWPGTGIVRTLKISLDLGNPLPPQTPANTSTRTPTRPTATPTLTRTVGSPLPTSTPGGPTPTCGGTIRRVGPGQAFTKPSQAAAVVQSNDCVHIDAGDYPDDVASWPLAASNVTIRGINGMVRLVVNGFVAESKAIWVLKGFGTTIENVEFACATSRTNNEHCPGLLVGDGNDAGLRLENSGVTIRNCKFRDSDNGILGGPSTTSGTPGDVLIENTEFFRNGLGDGQTHNLYLGPRHNTLTFRYNYSHGSITGHLFKSRALANHILYNRFMDEDNGLHDPEQCVESFCSNSPSACSNDGQCPGGTCVAKCSSSSIIDLPCGGLSYIIGNVMQKGAYSPSRYAIKYAGEMNQAAFAGTSDTTVLGHCPRLQSGPQLQELYVVNNTFVSDCGANCGSTGRATFIDGHFTNPQPPAPTPPIPMPVIGAYNNWLVGMGSTSCTGQSSGFTPVDGICWPPGAPTPAVGGNVLADTGLADRSAYDYHPVTGAVSINKGINPGTDPHGFPLLPTQQYKYDRNVEARPVSGVTDAGAYEFVTAPTPLPPATPTLTFTWTPSPNPTPTPPNPVYCPAGQQEAVYVVAASADDGDVVRTGTNYLSLGNPQETTGGYAAYSNNVVRSLSGTNYTVRMVLWRWDTSRLPDGREWIPGTTVAGAFVRPFFVGAPTGTRTLTYDWHEWSMPSLLSVLTDWALSTLSPEDPQFAASTALPAGGRQTVALDNAGGNVNLSGWTGLRLAVTDGLPIVGDSRVIVRPRDYQTRSGDQSAQLVVCYHTGPTPTPQPPSAPHLL